MEEKKLPLWFWPLVVGAIALMITTVVTDDPRWVAVPVVTAIGIGLAFGLGIFIKFYQSDNQRGKLVLVVGGLSLLCFGCVFTLSALGSFGAQLGAEYGQTANLNEHQARIYLNVGVPGALYLILFAAGFVATWMSGAGKIVGAILLFCAGLIGAFWWGQPMVLLVAAATGVGATVVAFIIGLMPKPSAGSTPIKMAFGGIFYGGVFFLLGGLLSFLTLIAGMTAPNQGVTIIAGFLTGAGIASAVLKSFQGD